jgi:ACT domain-containing protein
VKTYVVRLWLPDRPGALGQVASRIGAVRGDVVGIDILEREGGQAVDELVVELPDEGLVDALVREVRQVEGVAVEEVRPLLGERTHDPRLDALEAVAQLVGAADQVELLDDLVAQARRVIAAEWAAVVDAEPDGLELVSASGDAPPGPWLRAFVAGSAQSVDTALASDTAWAPLPAAGLALVLGRDGTPFRARERREVAAFARIADTRHKELRRAASRASHPSVRQ